MPKSLSFYKVSFETTQVKLQAYGGVIGKVFSGFFWRKHLT